MPSPFPGMDPYLERPADWPGFHGDLISEFKRQLAPKTGDRYQVGSEVLLFIHEPPAERRSFARADDAVLIAGGGAAAGTAMLAAPTTRMRVGDAVDVERHAYVEIRDARRRRVVTVIEVLSPSNKRRPEDRRVYEHKRDTLLRNGVSVLQVDLLRGGPRLLPEEATPHDYNAMLVRGERRSVADVWLWALRDRLPTLPVPLAEGDADVTLDLQAALDTVYDATNLAPFLYGEDPDPPLAGEDATWAAGLLAGAR